ncbi:hypothetical protein C4K08_2240 [Pseudomonas chlororaphis subsp. aureofaciens]|nr:hypothetical protein C4K08_2240 [Pseudomonas chlororaphis subsp. aureofaciens]
MNILEKVEIKGFWGDRSINIDFFKDVNFLLALMDLEKQRSSI